MGGCFEATPWPPCTLEAGPECFDAVSATTGGSGSSSGAGGGSIQTVTGASTPTTTMEPTTGPAATGTSSGTDNAPPVIELFAVQPGHLSEAGPALVQLAASEDVVTARLYLDGAEIAALAQAEFPHVYEALSAKDNGERVFKVVVEDAEGLTATAEATLTVQLPPAGAQKCLFVDSEAISSVVAGLVYTDAAIVAVGARDTGAGFRATVWKLGPDHCEVLPGWPKTIADWTADPALAAVPSRVSAVGIDAVGNLAIGANLTKDGKPQRYVAFLNPDGSRLWERPGKVGEEVTGVAVAPNTVVAVGWQRTSENPVRTDAMFWQHLEGGGVWAQELKAPFTAGELFVDDENQRSEWARAVLYEPGTGVLVVAGERELMVNVNEVFRRSFIARFAPLGGPVGEPWTSPGDVLAHDGTNTIASCGEQLLLGGWTRDKPLDAPLQPLTRWTGENGLPGQRLAEAMPGTQTYGIACDREGKLVHAASRPSGQLDARVFAFADPLGPRTWYEQGTPGDDAAGALACDQRGFCAWGGFRTVDGKLVAVVRVHHP